MKTQTKNIADGTTAVQTLLVPDTDEKVIGEWFFYYENRRQGNLCGELIIPEGITEIEKRAFNHLGVKYSLYRFPRSTKKLGEEIFYYDGIKVVYPGSSADFKAIATVREVSSYVSDSFDGYPYYNAGSRYETEYLSFDTSSDSIEVFCEEDGVTLLYGKRYRTGTQEPKTKN